MLLGARKALAFELNTAAPRRAVALSQAGETGRRHADELIAERHRKLFAIGRRGAFRSGIAWPDAYSDRFGSGGQEADGAGGAFVRCRARIEAEEWARAKIEAGALAWRHGDDRAGLFALAILTVVALGQATRHHAADACSALGIAVAAAANASGRAAAELGHPIDAEGAGPALTIRVLPAAFVEVEPWKVR